MYTFEHFTEGSRRVLKLAQEEAERSRHSYIGTEHLLLGMLREGDGIAAQAMRDLDVRIPAVCEALRSILGRDERIVVQQIVPTARVKRVLELAFEEARRMGSTQVDSEHLLLGLMIEGDGVGARVLSDLGATRERVARRVDELRLLRAEGGTATSPTRPKNPERAGLNLSPEVQRLLDRAGELAREAGARLVMPDHLRRAIAEGGM